MRISIPMTFHFSRMNSVNVENAIMNERARIHDEIMKIDLKDSIIKDGKAFVRVPEVLKIIGYDIHEQPI